MRTYISIHQHNGERPATAEGHCPDVKDDHVYVKFEIGETEVCLHFDNASQLVQWEQTVRNACQQALDEDEARGDTVETAAVKQ